MAQINIKNLNKKKPVTAARLARLVRFVYKRIPAIRHYEVCVILVSDRDIRELNRKYLHRDRATDVLCFSYCDDILKADIYVSTDTARSNARIFNTTFTEELYLYVIHGLLHMAGYRDDTALVRKKMNTLQITLLKQFTGIKA
ncbi:MAG: rRNA maturation RNase YbeY [Candidatus Omnitrophica bacterium]|nr:rRNA maturation RNase YbeY [Candidatus Omnitrophota bacterium]